MTLNRDTNPNVDRNNPRKEAATRWSRHLADRLSPRPASPPPPPLTPEEELQAAEARLGNYDPIPEWAPRADRRTLRAKSWAGLVGFKHAFRGDSSFFAHGYRAVLFILTGSLIGLPPVSWCLLIFALGLVLMAELTHSVIDTLARAMGDPEEPRLKSIRDMAASIVLVAVVCSAAVSGIVIAVRMIELFEGRG